MRDRANNRTITAAGGRREIPEDFKYKTKKVKHLKSILHNVSVAIGTLSSAANEFSRFKGPDISPDGMLGGVGYILPLKEIKKAIQTSVHGLSDVADCIADELTNPHWAIAEDKEVKELIKEKDKAVEDAEEEVEELDENISPDDLVTSAEVLEEERAMTAKKAALNKAVQKSLISFFVRN